MPPSRPASPPARIQTPEHSREHAWNPFRGEVGFIRAFGTGRSSGSGRASWARAGHHGVGGGVQDEQAVRPRQPVHLVRVMLRASLRKVMCMPGTARKTESIPGHGRGGEPGPRQRFVRVGGGELVDPTVGERPHSPFPSRHHFRGTQRCAEFLKSPRSVLRPSCPLACPTPCSPPCPTPCPTPCRDPAVSLRGVYVMGRSNSSGRGNQAGRKNPVRSWTSPRTRQPQGAWWRLPGLAPRRDRPRRIDHDDGICFPGPESHCRLFL